ITSKFCDCIFPLNMFATSFAFKPNCYGLLDLWFLDDIIFLKIIMRVFEPGAERTITNILHLY
ncbi:hypothetical protein ACJX0J_024001, partial [Zea mays]